MTVRIGPGFGDEIAAAGLLGLAFSWSKDGINYGEGMSDADRDRVEAVLARHDPDRVAPSALPDISDRQFAQVLALDGVISQPEALAWAARGDLPQKLKDALKEIPEAGGQRFGAEMMLSAATTYQRNHPLVPTLGALLGYDAAALDAIWTRGAAL